MESERVQRQTGCFLRARPGRDSLCRGPRREAPREPMHLANTPRQKSKPLNRISIAGGEVCFLAVVRERAAEPRGEPRPSWPCFLSAPTNQPGHAITAPRGTREGLGERPRCDFIFPARESMRDIALLRGVAVLLGFSPRGRGRQVPPRVRVYSRAAIKIVRKGGGGVAAKSREGRCSGI